MMKNFGLMVLAINLLLFFTNCSNTQENKKEPVSELTPSKSMYFDWININWYGGNENKVINNLLFFKWLNEEYGLKLDIYLIDAGNIDNGPVCNGCEKSLKNVPEYGGIESDWFLNKYPNGLDTIVNLAKSFGCQIGLWMGPDGYGTDDSTANKRIEMLDLLTSKYDIALFKFDACCSHLAPENEKHFIKAMQKCYKNNPELIVLNHRINLSDSANKYTSTFLWEGKETYIDVSAFNTKPAPHHRYTLDRGLPPELKRLTEDHGVCLSSFLNYWEDDLVLQAFNRNLILSPEIYGNPWLLNDEEFPLLARLFNLHRKYNDILVNGIALPEQQYGQYSVSRGNEKTRFLTFRNLTWETQKIKVDINESIGLSEASSFEVRQHHPFENIIGTFKYNNQVEIEVLPFRSTLVKISSEAIEPGIEGCHYKIVKHISEKQLEINLLALQGEEKTIKLTGIGNGFSKAVLDGENVSELLDEKSLEIKFNGDRTNDDYHKYLGELKEGVVPGNSSLFYETMYFAASNNCLEVQSLMRSGESQFEAVKAARNAFFEDDVFLKIGAWDKFALDNDTSTYFKVREYCDWVKPGITRINFNGELDVDEIHLTGLEDGYQVGNVQFSDDLNSWTDARTSLENNKLIIKVPSGKSVDYIKISPTPMQISELKAYKNNQLLDVNSTSISNLFPEKSPQLKQAFSNTIKVKNAFANSTLAVAIEGNYGHNGAFAVIEVDGKYIGAFDRSPAYTFNNWEHRINDHAGNYTYYFKLSEELLAHEITIYVFGTDREITINPKVWLTNYPIPYVKKKLILM